MAGKLGRGILIKMAYLFNQPNLSSGIDEAIVSTASAVPIFPIMLLAFIFFVVFVGGSANQKRRIGSADYPFWMILASLSMTMVALIFTLTSGIINSVVLSIVIGITILSGLWFFLSKARGEQ